MTTLTTLTTPTPPTLSNAPRLSELRASEWADEAKQALKASMFPKYAWHSGIEESRKDRLIRRVFPSFLTRRPDLEKKHIYTVNGEQEQNEQE